jgi:hypothetical protein
MGSGTNTLRVLKPDPMPAADRDGQPYRETDARTSGTLVPTCVRAREGMAARRTLIRPSGVQEGGELGEAGGTHGLKMPGADQRQAHKPATSASTSRSRQQAE